MSFDKIADMAGGIDMEMIQSYLDSVDDDQIRDAIEFTVNQYVVPHLNDIRHAAANEYPDHEQVREQLEQMDEQEREQIFYDTLSELVTTFALLRERPLEGLEQLKTMVRDPYTIEALLLIFENEDHIDAEYSDQLKEFSAAHLKWMGVFLVPEAYTQAEIQDVIETFDLDAEEIPLGYGMQGPVAEGDGQMQ